MSSIKVIKIKTKKNDIYKDILSSTNKVADIIRRSKNKKIWQDRFEKPNNNLVKHTPDNLVKHTPDNLVKHESKKPNKVRFDLSPKKQNTQIKKHKPLIKSNKTKTKKSSKKAIPISKFFTKKHKKTKTETTFTRDQIIKFIKLINETNFKKKQKYIYKLNKSQLNQILFALKVIKKKSKADKKLLRIILILYLDTNVKLI